MNEQNRSYDEIQSKTVILEDNEGVNDMLSALNTGRAALDKKKKEMELAERNKKIAIFIAVFVVAAAVLAGIFMVMGR
ncbi:MAG TPA: hypothetical protein PLD55_04880 [bacterium]|jgi:hypothetical protein|nr:hypothetical protein [bacterium]MDX9804551.1 hypothetical protein [bacterium]HNW16142.1 hypothetical protein [bacterium]HNZ53411.1 hypothetical protein [bacterium]HOG42906.1 hypothetical protein [bacterium]